MGILILKVLENKEKSSQKLPKSLKTTKLENFLKRRYQNRKMIH